ncbi:hypothetical protein D3C72_2495720 [compost metagenome]
MTRGRNGTLSHDYDAVSGPMVGNPKKLSRGVPPSPKGCQMAIFSAKAALIFDKAKKGDC